MAECCTAEPVDKGYGKLQYAALNLTGILSKFLWLDGYKDLEFPASLRGFLCATHTMHFFKNNNLDILLKTLWRLT